MGHICNFSLVGMGWAGEVLVWWAAHGAGGGLVLQPDCGAGLHSAQS